MNGSSPAPERLAPQAVAILLATLLAATLFVYLPVARNGWVWDDWTTVVGTLAARQGAEAPRWIWSALVEGHYQPVTWLSFALDDRLWPGRPGGYHATNVALHLLNVLLWWRLAGRLLALWRGRLPDELERRDQLVALVSAAIFALHPLRVESVAWATERRDLLSGTFFLLATLAYLAARSGSRRALDSATALVAAALCMLSKAQVTLPLVWIVLDVVPLGRLGGSAAGERWRRLAALAWEKLPLFLLALFLGAVALFAQSQSGALVAGADHGPLPRLAQVAYALCFYLYAALAATSWSPLHERPVALDPSEPRFFFALLAVALVAVALIRLRRRFPAAAAAAAAYVLLLAPVSGLAQSGMQLVADRYSYLALLGPTLVLTAALAAAVARLKRPARVASALALLLLLAAWGGLARRQVGFWSDDRTLWERVLAEGESAMAHNNLGQLDAQAGRSASAVLHLRRSLEIAPPYMRPWTAIAGLLELGRIGESEARELAPVLARSARFHPGSSRVAFALGATLAVAGQTAEARHELERSLRINPREAAARRALRALEVAPDRPEAPPG